MKTLFAIMDFENTCLCSFPVSIVDHCAYFFLVVDNDLDSVPSSLSNVQSPCSHVFQPERVRLFLGNTQLTRPKLPDSVILFDTVGVFLCTKDVNALPSDAQLLRACT